jgi:hypothetical protein
MAKDRFSKITQNCEPKAKRNKTKEDFKTDKGNETKRRGE